MKQERNTQYCLQWRSAPDGNPAVPATAGTKARNMAKKALMASVDNRNPVKIVGISKSDSVFGREYVTMKEKMALSVAMMKISHQVYGGYGLCPGWKMSQDVGQMAIRWMP